MRYRLHVIVLTAAFLALPAQGTAQQQDDVALPHGSWLAEEIRGAGVSEAVRSSLNLSAEGRASGSAGCNRFVGDVEVSDSRIAFGPIAATRMMCAPPEMDQEERFLNALSSATGWQIEDGRLALLDDGGDVAVRLAPAPEAAVITIPVPGTDTVDTQIASYRCGDHVVDVEYINAGPVSLAILRIDDEFVVAANVIAASGARYAGGRYVWWSRGRDEAIIEGLGQDEAEQLTCHVQ